MLLCGRHAAPLDRVRGEYLYAEGDAIEPARTQRLTRHPLRCCHAREGDAYDSIALVWLARSHGGQGIGLSYDFAALLAQIAIATLTGIEDDPSQPSYWPWTQAALVAATQLGFATYVLLLVLSIDRMENVMTGTQYLKLIISAYPCLSDPAHHS